MTAGPLLLGYLLLICAVITLAPFRFSWPEGLRVAWITSPADMVANVLLFLPLGFLCRPAGTPRAPGGHLAVWTAAVALSALLEAAQLFLPGRYPSPVDIATNSLGAWLGSLLRTRIEGWLTARLVRQLALELPLMNLVYLLIPLLWLDGLAAGSDTARLWLMPLLGLAGGSILAGVWRHRLGSAGTLSANGLALAAAAWFAAAALPGLARKPGFALACAVALGCLVRLEASLPRRTGDAERRFELPTLRRVWPLYAAYLALASLWPWPWAPGPWRAGLGLADLADLPGVTPLLRLLESLAGFTLLGYSVAEARGRHAESSGRAAWWVGASCVAGAGVLEVVRGFHPAQAASLLRLGLLTAAGLYGGLLYRLQLGMVRRLLAGPAESGTPPPAARGATDTRRGRP